MYIVSTEILNVFIFTGETMSISFDDILHRADKLSSTVLSSKTKDVREEILFVLNMTNHLSFLKIFASTLKHLE